MSKEILFESSYTEDNLPPSLKKFLNGELTLEEAKKERMKELRVDEME